MILIMRREREGTSSYIKANLNLPRSTFFLRTSILLFYDAHLLCGVTQFPLSPWACCPSPLLPSMNPLSKPSMALSPVNQHSTVPTLAISHIGKTKWYHVLLPQVVKTAGRRPSLPALGMALWMLVTRVPFALPLPRLTMTTLLTKTV